VGAFIVLQDVHGLNAAAARRVTLATALAPVDAAALHKSEPA
jgi:hypothetical protein